MKVSPKIAAKAKEEFGVDLDIEPKAARKPVKEKVKATEAKVEKAAKATAQKAKKTVKKAEATAKKPTKKLEIIVQSPMGGNITDAEIAAKLPKGTETVFVRVDQNKLWWIKGEETGSVDIW